MSVESLQKLNDLLIDVIRSDTNNSHTTVKSEKNKQLVIPNIKIQPLSKEYIDESAKLVTDMFAGPNAHDPSITGNMAFDAFYHVYKWFLTRNIKTVVIALLPKSIFKSLDDDNCDNHTDTIVKINRNDHDNNKESATVRDDFETNLETPNQTVNEEMMVVGVIQLKDHFDEQWVPQYLDEKYGTQWHMVFEMIEIIDNQEWHKYIQNEFSKENIKWKTKGILCNVFGIVTHYKLMRLGIGTQICDKVLTIAKKLGYKYCFAECSNIKSINLFVKKFNFVQFDELKYDSFEWPINSGIYPLRNWCKQKGYEKLVLVHKNL